MSTPSTQLFVPNLSALEKASQPIGPFIETGFSKQTRKFSRNWYSVIKDGRDLCPRAWLHYEPSVDLAFCFPCAKAHQLRVFINKTNSPFVVGGYSDWKNALSAISKHETGRDHMFALIIRFYSVLLAHFHVFFSSDASRALDSYLNQESVAQQLNTQLQANQANATACLEVIVTSILFLAAQGQALRGHDEEDGNFSGLLSLRAKDLPHFQRWLSQSKTWTSPAIQNEMIDIAAKLVQQKLVNKVLAAKYFSIISDETTDISRKEQVSTCIRISNDLQPEEMFLGLHTTTETTGEVLSKLLLEKLRDLGVDIRNCRGQTYDGASNMSGHLNGVQAHIQKVEPRAVYIHCANHVLNLAIEDAVNASSILSGAIELAHEVAKLFDTAKRTEILKASSDKLNEVAINLPTLCPTRWTSRFATLNAVVKMYGIILVSLDEISESPSWRGQDVVVKAAGLACVMRKTTSYFGLLVARCAWAL